MNHFISKIEKIIAETGIDIYSISRSKSRVLLRQAIYSEMHTQGFSYPEIGAFFNKHHTTILHSVKNLRPTNPYTTMVHRTMNYVNNS